MTGTTIMTTTDSQRPRSTQVPAREPDPYTTFRRAEVLLDAGAPARTAALLEPVHAADPTNAAVLELLARGYLGSAQLSRAERALRTLVDLQPTSGWARFALARALERQSRRDEAAVHRRLAASLGVTG